MNIFSAQIPSDASLTLQSCQVSAFEDLQLAGVELAPSGIGSAFLGLDGDLFFEDCHVFFALTVCINWLNMWNAFVSTWSGSAG